MRIQICIIAAIIVFCIGIGILGVRNIMADAESASPEPQAAESPAETPTETPSETPGSETPQANEEQGIVETWPLAWMSKPIAQPRLAHISEQEKADHKVASMPVDILPPSLGIDHITDEDGIFELPVNGAAGWAAQAMTLFSEPLRGSEAVLAIHAGQSFTIVEEDGAWWLVDVDGAEGWVEHNGCFINLPDVMPSIVYNITNSYSSMKRSGGYNIPNISGHQLYEGFSHNERLKRTEFFAPVLYATGQRVAAAQFAALEDGNTLVIHEMFRPRETQQSVVRNLTELVNVNLDLQRLINTPPWSIGSFIATSLSNHQRGAAIDVSLASVESWEYMESGDYSYRYVSGFTEYEMPSLMHELSPLAAPGGRMTDGSTLLRGYFVGAGFASIGSEWWHFDDWHGIAIATGRGITGEFYAAEPVSWPPSAIEAALQD